MASLSASKGWCSQLVKLNKKVDRDAERKVTSSVSIEVPSRKTPNQSKGISNKLINDQNNRRCVHNDPHLLLPPTS